MKTMKFDDSSCTRCGLCSTVCPSRSIVQESPTSLPSPAESAQDRCISCNHCVAICPTGAVTVDGIAGAACESLDGKNLPQFDLVANLVRARRSIRRYADTPIAQHEIERLLDVVRWAPSAKNGLPVRWVVVENRAKVVELEALVVEWFDTLHGMGEIVEAWKRGADPIFRGAPCVIAAYTDASAIWPEVDATIAVETLDLCAAAMRLGACWAGFFIQAAKKYPKINQWLGLDSTQTVQAGLMVGRIGDEDYRNIPHRPDVSIRWVR